MRPYFVASVAIATGLTLAGVAHAAETAYPQRPVRLITGSTGSTADLTARFIAQKLGEQWRHQVVVDNRSGAGGIIGGEIVMRSPPTAIRCT